MSGLPERLSRRVTDRPRHTFVVETLPAAVAKRRAAAPPRSSRAALVKEGQSHRAYWGPIVSKGLRSGEPASQVSAKRDLSTGRVRVDEEIEALLLDALDDPGVYTFQERDWDDVDDELGRRLVTRHKSVAEEAVRILGYGQRRDRSVAVIEGRIDARGEEASESRSRPPSAAGFRAELAGFVRHRASARLVDDAIVLLYATRARTFVNRWSRNAVGLSLVAALGTSLSHGVGWLRGDDVALRGDSPTQVVFAVLFSVGSLLLSRRLVFPALVARSPRASRRSGRRAHSGPRPSR